VTGTLGDSAAGLELWRTRGKGQGARGKEEEKKLIEKHLRPMPRIPEGMRLAGVASAMIDVSDGLSSDLAHLCEQSGVGAEVLADRVPLSKELRSVRGLARPAVEYALSGGEDYELLFTAPRAMLGRLRTLRTGATEIGRITSGRDIVLVGENGRKAPLPPSGYDHFRAAPRSARSGR